MTLSATAFIEKNKLATNYTWLILMDITLPDTSVIRICGNSENVTWPVSGGNVYTAFPFDIAEIGDTSKGEVPSVNIKISNVTRSMEPYLDTYDGMIGSTVKLYVVNSKNVTTPSLGAGVNNANPEVELEYEIISSGSDSMWATFTIGAANPFNKRFPRNRIMRNLCRYKAFKGDQCQYVGAQTSCDRTLDTCRNTMLNEEHFGGFPGVGSRGVYV